MSSRRPSAGQDLHRLGSKLTALSSTNRLRLISQLSEAQTVDDVDLRPDRSGEDRDQDADRQLTRQGVRHHLKKLEETDLVRSAMRPNDQGRDRREYMVNEPAVFGLLEELRSLLAPGTEKELRPFETQMASGAGTGARDWPEGPKLVLLQGSGEEKVFDLGRIDPNPAAGRGWVIGRSSETEIPLQYDPYLSAQNAEIVNEDGEFRIVDLRVSTNGTRVNEERLEPGTEKTLEHGDIVKVGCSALVFHDGEPRP